MDEKGFIASFDAVLGLLVVIILMGTIVTVSNTQCDSPSQFQSLNQDAQDVLILMASSSANSGQGPEPVLSKVVHVLKDNKNTPQAVAAAGEIAGEFLNMTMGSVKYNLTENKQLNGTTLACNADMKGVANIDVATCTWENYSFTLCVWR